MKSILSIIKDFMKKEGNVGVSFTFDQIFEQVEKALSPEWAKNKNIDFDEMVLNKKGETYKLLTIDGSFIRNDDGSFYLKNN